MKRYERSLTVGMRCAGWAAIVHVGLELLMFAKMVRDTAPEGWLAPMMVAVIGVTIVLSVLMFRGLVLSYYVMAGYGILRLLVGALAVAAVATGALERIEPLFVFGLLNAMPFALLWIIGGIAVWRAGRRSVLTTASIARAV